MPEAFPDPIAQSACQPTRPPALLDRLRNETAPQHRRLEDRLGLLRSDLSLNAYAQILGRFYGFYRPWESNLARTASKFLPDFTKRQQKVRNLMSDLAYLDVDVSTLPVCTCLPQCEHIAQALGGLYVTEGATLGGQIISRHLRRCFAFPPGCGDTFFQSYGSEVGHMWSSFREVLSRHSSSSADDEIVRAAQQTFQSFEDWLCEANP